MISIDSILNSIYQEVDFDEDQFACPYGPPATTESIETEQQGWIPKGETLEFAGRKIPGMVYFGKPETRECHSCGKLHDSGVYINPVLPVEKPGKRKSEFIPMSHSYHAMSPGWRGQFLDWHASGRSESKCNNFIFPLNYFYGLERRFFNDDPDEQERKEIIEEVDRLHKIYHRYSKLDFDVSNFKKYATPTGAKAVTLKDDNAKLYGLLLKTREEWEKQGSDSPLNAQECLRIFKEALKLKLAKGHCVEPYSGQLFEILFAGYFPNGVDIAERRKPRTMYYRAGSDEFSAAVPYSYKGGQYIEFKKLRNEFKNIFHFGEKVFQELDEYSKFVKNQPEKADSFEAVKKLPLELWGKFGRYQQEIEQHMSGLVEWARKLIENGTTLATKDIDLNLNRDIWKERLNYDYPGGLSVPLALCGFGIARDYCLRYQAVQENDPIMIYEMQTKNGLIDEETESYRKALTEFAVGAYVLNTENRPPEESEKLLSAMISKRKDLTKNERNRLNANMRCVLAVPHDKAFLRRLNKEITDEWKSGICQFLINMAHMEGMANAKTISIIEKIYPKLGLNPADAYADLHAGTAASSAKQEKGNGSKVSEMDESRIESIRSDTQKVSDVLGEIFTAEEEAKDAPEEDEGQILLSGLDNKHATLLQNLLDRDYWTLDEFEELSRNHGLLPVGAVETINEWMFEKYDEPLLDEQDGFHLSPEISELLKTEFDAVH